MSSNCWKSTPRHEIGVGWICGQHGQKADGKPDMLVYRKTAEPTVAITSRESVLGCLEQHEQLLEFIGKWFTGSDGTIAGVYHAFETTEDFEELLEIHLRKVVRKQLAASAG